MVILNNGRNEIRYTLGNSLLKCQKTNSSVYMVDVPKVSCTNEKDAEMIQQELNDLVGRLSHKLIEQYQKEDKEYE